MSLLEMRRKQRKEEARKGKNHKNKKNEEKKQQIHPIITLDLPGARIFQIPSPQ